MAVWLRLKSILTDNLALIFSVLAAFAVGGVLILMAGANPLDAYMNLADGAFGSVRAITNTLVKTIPLLLIGVGLTIAYKCRVWNIGAEGQLFMGATLATWMGITFTGIPALALIPLAIVGGFLAGGLWAAIPGILKAKLEVNEVITTVMMNYIAILEMRYLITGPMGDPAGHGFPLSPPIAPSAYLPKILPEDLVREASRLHAGILIALASAVLVYMLFSKTTLGYQIRVVGANREAARYGGIGVFKSIVIAMFLSGGFAGLAGMVEVFGVHHRLMEGISPGYGYTAIVVALLGKLHPGGVVLAAFFFAALIVGGDTMAYRSGIPIFLAYVIQGVVILFVLASEHSRWFKRRE